MKTKTQKMILTEGYGASPVLAPQVFLSNQACPEREAEARSFGCDCPGRLVG